MLIFAHRGLVSLQHAENTLGAFRAALEAGARGIEFDLRVSKDKEIVIVHDANLHRVAGDAHRVSELTTMELCSLSLRHGGMIPTLNQVTAAIHAPTFLDMEVKSPDVVPHLLLKLKTSAALRERTIVSSFQAGILAKISKELPDVRLLLLVSRWPLPLRRAALIRRLNVLRPWAVGFPLAILDVRRVTFVRDLGLHIATWDQRGTRREARKAHRLAVDIAILHHLLT